MKVILLREVKGVGRKDAIVEVTEGYARNFLLPQKYAEVATTARITRTQQEMKNAAQEQEARHKEMAQLAVHLAHVRVTVQAAASAKGKLFGRVTEAMVVAALKQQGFSVTEKVVSFPSPIDHVGDHHAIINLTTAHVATITVTVVADTHHA